MTKGTFIRDRTSASTVPLKSLEEATLYTAFKRLEDQGFIASYWGNSGAGARRRYYTITPNGRDACHRLLAEWEETKEIMDKLMNREVHT